jgi:SagB-type dehydrogenase family enzyme
LPDVKRLSYDLAPVCRKRHSPETDFVLGKVSQPQLAALLQEATASFSYLNDLDGSHEKPASRVSLYGCLHGVEGIPDGAYYYDSANHALRRVRFGDHRLWLQQGMTLDNVNLFQVPLCLHVVGDKDHLKTELGYRGYRIQQMEAGMLVQRLLLAATAIGMGGRPLLGFDANSCDELYKLAPQGKTSLIQIPVGPYRYLPRLEGGLYG